ncbi:septal ring lytic transglycosylase RlpA family protein [Shewanella sp.]|uniref:septal ring lytic transglycosylase RlpA family protein n=1 Tax=Shewanella sp. TaxID=50422 RepID=UPI004053B77D
MQNNAYLGSRLTILTSRSLSVLVCCLIFAACSSSSNSSKGGNKNSQSGRYQMANDRAPANAPDVSKVPNAVPKYEPYSRQGNRDYKVLGKNYSVLSHGKDFRQRGIASWYGSKFHGHLTSNGEVYDMYTMSAAHKTLPIPSYVKVRNEDNNREIIVRVNDRGPFHEGRVIDLSYAAAYKLGVLSTGTARVNLEAIYFPTPSSRALAELADPHVNFIQITASRDKVRINHLAQQLESKYGVSSKIESVNGFYRLRLGPIGQRQLADKLLQNLKRDGFPDSFMVEQAKR